MMRYVEGDIAIVTQSSGNKYVGVYTLAPGIDFFWHPLIPGSADNLLTYDDIDATVVGKASNDS